MNKCEKNSFTRILEITIFISNKKWEMNHHHHLLHHLELIQLVKFIACVNNIFKSIGIFHHFHTFTCPFSCVSIIYMPVRARVYSTTHSHAIFSFIYWDYIVNKCMNARSDTLFFFAFCYSQLVVLFTHVLHFLFFLFGFLFLSFEYTLPTICNFSQMNRIIKMDLEKWRDDCRVIKNCSWKKISQISILSGSKNF